jgi:hypothetical protein
MLANSTPITPPPRITAVSGITLSTNASSLIITRGPSATPAGTAGDDPVANTTFCAPTDASLTSIVGVRQPSVACNHSNAAR